MSWQFVNLKDVCDIKTGRKDANHGENDGPYPFYTCALKPIKSPTKSFDAPAIILPGNGANVGKVLYCNEPFEAYQRTYILNDFRNIDFDFLKFYFKYRWVRHVQTDQYGSATNYLRMRNFDEFQVPLPPKSAQKRIATILDKADALREKRRQAIAKLDELLQSVFLDMFGDPVTNPKGWGIVKLPDTAIHFCDGPFGSNLKTEHYKEFGVRVVRLKNIGVGEFVDRDKVFISKEHYNSLPRNHCFPEDILIGTLGDPNLRACILPKTISCALNKADCVLLRPNKETATAEYLCWLINNPSLLAKASGLILGQTRLRISMGRLKSLDIPLPPLSIQQQFSDTVKKIQDIKSDKLMHNDKLDNLFASLQQRAFKGDL